MLGFNTTLNLDAVGKGTVAGYYGMAGCRTYNDPMDRGCMQGVTRPKVDLMFFEFALQLFITFQLSMPLSEQILLKQLGSRNPRRSVQCPGELLPCGLRGLERLPQRLGLHPEHLQKYGP